MSRLSWEICEEGVWSVDSGHPGNNVALLTGVHGDEPTSLLMAEHLLQEPPRIEEGSVTLIVANPLASQERKHYIDTNMNRCFFLRKPLDLITGYEAERVEQVKPYLLRADAMLDTHDTSSACPPFLICERNALDTALKIGQQPTGAGMTISFGFSAMEPGGSDDFMFQQGKEGICHETGDMYNPESNLPGALDVVRRFLTVHGLIEGEVSLPKLNPMLIEIYRSIKASEGFKWAEEFSNFQVLREGQKLADTENGSVYAGGNDVMLFPARKIIPGSEACGLAKVVEA